MELYFLGTGAGTPSKQRNVTSIALRLGQERRSFWLFDCGEGTQHQILRSPLRLSRLEMLFVTHLHGDHIFGIPGLLSSRSVQGVDSALNIFGPRGLSNFILTALSASNAHLTYPLEFHEVDDGPVFTDSGFTVEARRLEHGVECFGYRIVEHDLPGKLLVDRLQAENVPAGPVYAKLKRGESVVLADGRVLDGRSFVSPAQPGRKLAILGDTARCESAALLAQDVDVLVHEATFSAEDAALARAYQHSTTLDAAYTAISSRAKSLIMTHVSARYDDDACNQLLHEAQAVFPQTWMAKDGWTFEVPLA